MKSLKITLTFLTLFTCFNATTAQKKYGNISFKKAKNISENQRILGQKMAKAYLLLSNTPNDAKAKKVLMKSSKKFEKQNQILLKNAVSNNTKKHLNTVSNLWSNFKNILKDTPNDESVYEVIQINSTLMKTSNNVISSIATDNEYSKELKASNDEVELLYNEFNDAITLLLVSNLDKDTVDDALVMAMLRWENLGNNKDQLFNNKFDDMNLYVKSNELTEAFNDIAVLYENITMN